MSDFDFTNLADKIAEDIRAATGIDPRIEITAGWNEYSNGIVCKSLSANISLTGNWISVDERLPEFQEEVLISYIRLGQRETVVAWMCSGGEFMQPLGDQYTEYAPTHWMPLPEPPK